MDVMLGRSAFNCSVWNYHNWAPQVGFAWSPQYFKGTSLMDEALGGWQISGILTSHSGYPWTPQHGNFGCNLVYQNSGYCNLRPAAYLGGGGTNYSNSTFEQPNGNFPKGALAYFTVPKC